MDGLWTEVCGQQKQSNNPGNNQHNPQYANYWAPLPSKRHIPPHSAQPQHTNHWAPRTRKRHQQEHRPQRPTERSDPTQHAKGRTGDCPGPRKGATTRRNVTRGGTPPVVWGGIWWGWAGAVAAAAAAIPTLLPRDAAGDVCEHLHDQVRAAALHRGHRDPGLCRGMHGPVALWVWGDCPSEALWRPDFLLTNEHEQKGRLWGGGVLVLVLVHQGHLLVRL